VIKLDNDLTCIEVPFGPVESGTMYLHFLENNAKEMPWLDFLYKHCSRWDANSRKLAIDEYLFEIIYCFYLDPEIETFYRLKFG
jgi:hypothetical protein